MTKFSNRHIGPDAAEKAAMLTKIGVNSIEELINKTIPAHIRLNGELNISKAMSEQEYLYHITELGKKNKLFKSFIGLGYNETIVPSVILRNVLENPGWYTAYTPYQAEISQGRLEALLNFQTMIAELTGMELTNASLLDEGTAAAEAMIMFYNSRSRAEIKEGKNKCFISENCFPQTIAVVAGKAKNLDIDLTIGNPLTFVATDDYFGAIIQYPDVQGTVSDIAPIVSKLQEAGVQVAVGADLLSLVLLNSPGSLGADVVFGSTQRFGVPMGSGGPHAAYFGAKDSYKRQMPGRIIGVSIDDDQNQAYRMALQTREQHIKRGNATSNICTAQALLAVMASMYAVYHGPKGIKYIAEHVHSLATKTANGLKQMGIEVGSDVFFDTVWVKGIDSAKVKAVAEKNEVNFNYLNNSELTINFGEPHTLAEVNTILSVLAEATGKSVVTVSEEIESNLEAISL
jgi:glycine dehydrogenase